VLLGLHRDVEGQHQSLLDTREEFNSRANEINKHLITQAKEIRRLKCFCFGSYLVALIIAVVVWLSR
jgi:t-SNARE complex subunit (syntaxin)